MTQSIINAAPLVIELGIQDSSARELPRIEDLAPIHCPKFFFFAQKGPTTDQLVSGVDRDNMYGSETFNLLSKYANHATVFANAVNAEGNVYINHRVVPDDANPEATLTFSLEVFPATVQQYTRDADGLLILDVDQNPIPDGTNTLGGYICRWIVSDNFTDGTTFGQRATVEIPDEPTYNTSGIAHRYPIFEVKISYIGEAGNNSGLRVWAPNKITNPILPQAIFDEVRAYPFYIAVINRPDTLTTPKVIPTILADQNILCTFKEGSIDPTTTRVLHLSDNFLQSYQQLTDPTYPPVYGEFGSIAIYQNNIDYLCELFQQNEIQNPEIWHDFTTSPDDKYLFNLIGGVSSNGAPYKSVEYKYGTAGVQLTSLMNNYAAGGSDGTISDANFNILVGAEMDRYLDSYDKVSHVLTQVEGDFYDSGFPLATKYKLVQALARKDVFVYMSTTEAGGPKMSTADEMAIGIALMSKIQSFPESDYFATSAARAMIISRSGLVKNSLYKKRLPLTYEIAIKAAKYMGASNGIWKNGFSFDHGINAGVQYMYDISESWVPAIVRNQLWSAGINWIDARSRRELFFPALKTVFKNDTSVLTSYFTAKAAAYLDKVAHRAWAEYTGSDSLLNAQLAERVENFVTSEISNPDIFDGRFIIIPKVSFTDADIARGYSWTLSIELYAANMKTVMATYVRTFRREDLEVTA